MTTPASYSPGANDAFTSGVAHQVNPGRANAGSITLNGTASTADQGLDQTAQHWAATTPHAVLATTAGAGSDGSWQRMQRDAGGYAPGQMENLSDQLSNGNDDLP
jgi:hypothetical protein